MQPSHIGAGQERLKAIAEIARYAKLHPAPAGFDATQMIRRQRDERAEQIVRNVGKSRK
jgi:hypothetical protein